MINFPNKREVPPTIRQIYRAAKRQSDAIKSIEVKYEATWDLLEKMPADPARGLSLEQFQVHMLVMDEKRKCIRSMTSKRYGSPRRATFDGHVSVEYHGPALSVIQAGMARVCEHDYFIEQVVNQPLRDREQVWTRRFIYYPARLRTLPVLQTSFRVQSEPELIDNHNCYVVEARNEKLWVDPAINSWYRRREKREWRIDQGERRPFLRTREQLSEFVLLKDGIWLPKVYRMDYFASGTNPPQYWNRPYMRLTLEASHLAVNHLSEEDFRTELQAGVYVSDWRNQTLYHLAEATSDLLTTLKNDGERLIVTE